MSCHKPIIKYEKIEVVYPSVASGLLFVALTWGRRDKIMSKPQFQMSPTKQ